ncbi:hypothetical protein PAPHI01_1210 [Pancytospora philotis]|nr:hypothetical protein PAPHI01_1210 [Pancytospora philotis]
MFAIAQQMLAVFVTGSRAGAAPEAMEQGSGRCNPGGCIVLNDDDQRTLDKLYTKCKEYTPRNFVRPELGSSGPIFERRIADANLAHKMQYVYDSIRDSHDAKYPNYKFITRVLTRQIVQLDLFNFRELIFLRRMVTFESSVDINSTTNTSEYSLASMFGQIAGNLADGLDIFKNKVERAIKDLLEENHIDLFSHYREYIGFVDMRDYIIERYGTNLSKLCADRRELEKIYHKEAPKRSKELLDIAAIMAKRENELSAPKE